VMEGVLLRQGYIAELRRMREIEIGEGVVNEVLPVSVPAA